MVRRICEITVTLYFTFRLVLYSHEDVSSNIVCLNVLEGIKQFYLSMWFKKTRLETPFKGDNVKALIKTPHCPLFLREGSNIGIFAVFFVFVLFFVFSIYLFIYFLGFSDQTIA